jgi:hypothetical protein
MGVRELINLQVTMFVLMMVGFVLKRTNRISDAAKDGITDLVIYVVLPCNIVKSFLISFDEEIMKSFLAVFVISILVQIMSTILGRTLYRKQEDGKRKVLRYGIICSNAGFLGNPIAEGVFGSMGLSYASVFLIPMRVVMWSAGISMFTESPGKKQLFKKVITHPCIVAVFVGLVLMLLQVQLPEVILTPLTYLSNCNTALSMIVIGCILAQLNLRTMINRTVLSYCGLRMVIMPLVVFIGCMLCQVEALTMGVCVLLTAMPAGATTVILASKYEGDAPFATKIVVISTLLSLLTTPIWSMILLNL